MSNIFDESEFSSDSWFRSNVFPLCHWLLASNSVYSCPLVSCQNLQRLNHFVELYMQHLNGSLLWSFVWECASLHVFSILSLFTLSILRKLQYRWLFSSDDIILHKYFFLLYTIILIDTNKLFLFTLKTKKLNIFFSHVFSVFFLVYYVLFVRCVASGARQLGSVVSLLWVAYTTGSRFRSSVHSPADVRKLDFVTAK